MLKPPFKLAASINDADVASVVAGAYRPVACCEGGAAVAESGTAIAATATARARLADLDLHLHCSVIGTCVGTAELRKLMARFLFVRDSSDLEVHHEAVAHAAQGGPVTKALNKLLEQRHEAVVHCFARARGAQSLGASWDEALRQGEVPGAYWAVLTHRDVTPALRQRAFGDVHMLSHLVGGANRADIRRLAALERENAEWRERSERQQLRGEQLLDERDTNIAALTQSLAQAQRELAAAQAQQALGPSPRVGELQAVAERVALHTGRRERAEQSAAVASEEAARLRDELEHLQRHANALGRELAAIEGQLRERSDAVDAPLDALAAQLRGRRLLYVGGRPSAMPSIRDLVLRHGGEFQRHDGGLEDRKGMLAAGIAWAQLVVFPVDCIDHDSAGNLKRLCLRQGVPFMPLRSAGVASFAAALLDAAGGGSADEPDRPVSPGWLKHG